MIFIVSITCPWLRCMGPYIPPLDKDTGLCPFYPSTFRDIDIITLYLLYCCGHVLLIYCDDIGILV